MSKPSLIVALAERFPLAFLVKQRRPLKVGVCKDIIAAWPDIDAEQLSRALGWYANGVGYLANLKEGTARIGLDGAPAGVVTAAEAEGARARLKALFKRRGKQAKAAAPKGGPRAANAAPGGKKENTTRNASVAANAATRQVSRLSLDGLRLAARARRESARQPHLAEGRR
jgi:ProP effector